METHCPRLNTKTVGTDFLNLVNGRKLNLEVLLRNFLLAFWTILFCCLPPCFDDLPEIAFLTAWQSPLEFLPAAVCAVTATPGLGLDISPLELDRHYFTTCFLNFELQTVLKCQQNSSSYFVLCLACELIKLGLLYENCAHLARSQCDI